MKCELEGAAWHWVNICKRQTPWNSLGFLPGLATHQRCYFWSSPEQGMPSNTEETGDGLDSGGVVALFLLVALFLIR